MIGASGKIAQAAKIDFTRWYEPDSLPGYASSHNPYDIAGQGPLLVLAGSKVIAGAYSLDGGITWVDTAGLLDVGNDANGAAYNPANGVFVIAGQNSGGNSKIVKNADLTGSWTNIDDPIDVILNDAEFGGGTWVLVGNDDTSNATILVSTDADPTTFTNKTFTDYYTQVVDALKVAYAPNAATNQWCISLGRGVSNFVYSDDNGATWTNPFESSNGASNNLAASDDTFIACSTTATIWRNVDGAAGGFSDVSPSLGFTGTLTGIAYGAGYWVAVGLVNSGYPVVIVSDDNGSTWTRVGDATQLGTRNARCVSFNGHRFIIGMDQPASADLNLRFTW